MNDPQQTISFVIDSREQLPFCFDSDDIEIIHKALPTGDYSLSGYENLVAVERKNLEDFIHSAIHTRGRFFSEIRRLSTMPFKCIVIEGSLADVLGHRYRSGADPASIFGTTLSIIVDYGVPVFFCCDRQIALAFTEKYLRRVHRKLTCEKRKVEKEES